MLDALRTDNSPFSPEQIEGLQSSIGNLNPNQATWLSGYLAGKLSSGSVPAPVADFGEIANTSSAALNVIYATQTGTGEDLAQKLAIEAETQGLSVQLQSLGELRPQALKKMEYAAFVISTHGEGDPPDDAIDLFDYLQSERAPRLDKLKFHVLALGDSTYSQFCEAGRRLEELLVARGATTLSERVDCDLDFEAAAGQWSTDVIDHGRIELGSSPQTAVQAHLSVVPSVSEWTRRKPFPSTVEKIQKITGLESSKEVYHLELSLEDSAIHYQPGDSLGIWAPNASTLVSSVLQLLGIDPLEHVEDGEEQASISEVLKHRRELTRLSPDVLRKYATLCKGQKLEKQLDRMDDIDTRKFVEQRQFIDLVQAYPADIGAQELAALLKPLAPRSYSIASSQDHVDEEVHLTVASLSSNALGQKRDGVASNHLNHFLKAGDDVKVFLEPNRRFRLPEDRSKPVILISAGTGIAPYRAFLQQLDSENAKTDTWLIYGNPNLRTDFLYQREWLSWRSKGLLNRIDCAFSRDQKEKHYVQNVVQENIAEISRWLERGASIYLCGGLAMGQSVEETLRDGLGSLRGLNDSAAAEVIANLRRERRLLKDLY